METPETLPFEELALQKNTPAWLVAAVKAGNRLPVGAQLTEAEFNDMVEKTANSPCGYGLESK